MISLIKILITKVAHTQGPL